MKLLSKPIETKQFIFTFIIAIISFAIILSNFIINGLSIDLSGNGVFVNQFSFFTIQSNVIVCVFFILLTITNGLNCKNYYEKLNLPYIRGVITIWIIITGIVFAFILNPTIIYAQYKLNANITIDETLFNFGLHIIIPVIVAINSLWYKYQKKCNYLKFAIITCIYPLVYAIIAILVGHFTNVYPYFFLDPNSSINNRLHNYLGVVLWIIVILLFFLMFIWIYIKDINLNYQKNKSTANLKYKKHVK